MALSAGQMLYYDGSEWVNSTTIVSSFFHFQGQTIFLALDANTNTVPYPAQVRHQYSGSQPSLITAPFGVAIQYFGTDTSGNLQEIATIQGVESDPAKGTNAGVQRSYLLFSAYQNQVSPQSSIGTLLLGDPNDGVGAGVCCVQPVRGYSGASLPFRFSFFTRDLTGKTSPYSLLNTEYQCPIIKFTNASAAMTITFPATAGGFWILYNNSGFTLTLNPGSLTLNNNQHGIYFADGTNLQQVATPA